MFLGDFCKLNKPPSDVTRLGKPPGGFCDADCCCCFTSLEVFLPLLLFDVVSYSSVSYHRVFTPILYFQSSSSQSDLRHFHLTFLGFSVTGLPRVPRFWVGIFYPQAFFTYHIGACFVTQMWAGTSHLGSSSVPALTRLFFRFDAWSWTTNIVDPRPLVYQLCQWATNYKVIKLLSMFQPTYACSKS